jgi:beta-glucanase (GH16 family)
VEDGEQLVTGGWQTDFFDDFDTFNSANWQDQRIWVNNETHCYVPDNQFGTREVSDGSLKLKVVNIGEKRSCDNFDKHGNQHPDTEYVAGRIASKNRQEFVKGKWTARLRTWGNGEASMFPAWWLLGAYTTGAIKNLGECDKGDWWTLRIDVTNTLDEYHEYSVEWSGSDLVFRVDGAEVHRNVGEGDNYPEPMFAILNYAKITDSPMNGEWVMEVDWVKHEHRR